MQADPIHFLPRPLTEGAQGFPCVPVPGTRPDPAPHVTNQWGWTEHTVLSAPQMKRMGLFFIHIYTCNKVLYENLQLSLFSMGWDGVHVSKLPDFVRLSMSCGLSADLILRAIKHLPR